VSKQLQFFLPIDDDALIGSILGQRTRERRHGVILQWRLTRRRGPTLVSHVNNAPVYSSGNAGDAVQGSAKEDVRHRMVWMLVDAMGEVDVVRFELGQYGRQVVNQRVRDERRGPTGSPGMFVDELRKGGPGRGLARHTLSGWEHSLN
jgi:hypothetical protein